MAAQGMLHATPPSLKWKRAAWGPLPPRTLHRLTTQPKVLDDREPCPRVCDSRPPSGSDDETIVRSGLPSGEDLLVRSRETSHSPVGLKAQCAVDAEAKSAPTGLLDAYRGFAFVETAFEEDEATFEVVTELG